MESSPASASGERGNVAHMSDFAHLLRRAGQLKVRCDECGIETDWIDQGTDGEGAEAAYEIMMDHNAEAHPA